MNALSAPASIVELARALRHDPDLIYEFVHDNIRYYPIWGVHKGPLGALIDGEGTAFDQAALLVALLRESGYAASYQLGRVEIDAAQAQSWFGFESAQVCPILQLISQAQVPIHGAVATQAGSCPGSDADLVSLQISHVWVKVTIDGTDYQFDPSLKALAVKSGIDLVSATGYNPATYAADAESGATITADFVQNLNTAGIRANLKNYADNLIDHIRNNAPAAALDDIIGGSSIVALGNIAALRQTGLPYQVSGVAVTEWTEDIPDSYRPTLQIRYQGIDQTFTSDAIYGKRLTLFFNAANEPELRLDGALIATGSATSPGTPTTIQFNVKHNAYANTGTNQAFDQSIQAGGAYVISNGWGPVNRPMVDRHQDILRANIAAGGADGAEDVLGESLSAIAFAWLAEITASSNLTDRIADTVTLYHHQIGITGQNDGPYVDLPGNIVGVVSKQGDQAVATAVFWDLATHNSIFESVAVEQIGGVSAVSTVKLIDIANAEGLPIFDATQSNYATQVAPNLTACEGFIASFQNAIDADHRLVLPSRCDIGESSWGGSGYFDIRDTSGGQAIGALINGTLLGGFPSTPQPPAAVNTTTNNPATFQNPVTEGRAQSPSGTFGDPVDIFKGNYLLSNQDITVGQGNFPYSLSFQRFYSSSNRHRRSVLGNAWTHNFDISVREGVDGFQGMGEDSPIDAATSIAEKLVSLDLLKDPAKPIEKLVTAAIGQRWFADQLLNNTLIVKNGQNSALFVKLPNGEYQPPPGVAARLIRNGDGTYTYETLDKIRIAFGADGRIAQWTHPNGATVRFTYTDDQLARVENSLGRALTFAYTGDQLTQVADGNGRAVNYAHDANDDLTQFTDVMGQTTTFEYDQPGRMSKIFYPTRPTEPFVSNVYDTLGRVQTQTNANGDTWAYYFAGSRSEEEDPNGEYKIRYQDRFGKPLRIIDEVGREVVNRYDGQTRIIRSTQPEGNATAYRYDDATCGGETNLCSHNVLTVTDTPKPGSTLAPLTQSFSYHPTFGKVASSTDARGAATDYAYDATTGELNAVTLPADLDGKRPEQRLTYATFNSSNLGGDFILLGSRTDKLSDTQSVVTEYTYESANHSVPKTVTVDVGGLNLVTSSVYDAIGNLQQVDGPRTDVSDVTTYGYDAARRLTSSIDPLGNETRHAYDAEGALIRSAAQADDTQWQVICTTYTPTKKIAQVWGPALSAAADACPAQAAPVAVTDSVYDALDRVSILTNQLPPEQGGARSTKTEYYPDGRTWRVIRGLGSALEQAASTVTYTANGQMATLADAAGNLTTYEYDGFDRQAATRFPDPAQPGQSSTTDREDFTYDENSNLKRWQRRSGEAIGYDYDALDRLVEKRLRNEQRKHSALPIRRRRPAYRKGCRWPGQRLSL